MEETPLSKADAIAIEFKEFTHIVSHDFSAPLRGIVEFSKLLKAEQLDVLNDEGKEYLSLILESGEKLQAMMAGLLEYSRLNTVAKPLSTIDCNKVLNDCKTALQGKIKASNGKLEIGALPSITADTDRLTRLFTLLLDNAFKFHAKGATPIVSVSAIEDNGNWVFTVRDNGIGIEEGFYKRIFQPFQRLHTEAEYPGTGMGLTIAKKIVDIYGGKMWIESVYGDSTSFIFSIPQKVTG